MENMKINDIRVLGKTSPYEVTLASRNEPLAVDSYLVIRDRVNGDVVCRVIASESDAADGEAKYKATAKIEGSITYPIETGSAVVKPRFDQIKKLVMSVSPPDGLMLGEIAGTAFDDVPADYKGLAVMKDENGFREQSAIPFVFDYRKLYESPHIGLFGGSGSGKTIAMKSVIEEIMKRGIPGVVLDPHLEMNFTAGNPAVPEKFRRNFAASSEIFSVGQDNFGIMFSDLTTDQLILIMSFSGELSGPMEALLRTLHKSGSTLFELRDLIDKLVGLMEKMERGADLTDDENRLCKLYLAKIPGFSTLIALSWRLSALEATGVFNGNESSLVQAIQNRKMCILRGSMEQIHIVASHVIEKLYSARRRFIDSRESGADANPFPPFFVAMDEAHIFCPSSSVFSLTKKTLRIIAQEGRKYGVFEILATQRPSLLDETVVAQMASKFIFRLSIKEDLESIKKETDLSHEEIRKLPYMPSGSCYVSSSITGRTLFVKMRFGVTAAKNAINPFDELPSSNNELGEIEKAIVSMLPFNDLKKMDVVQAINNKTGENISIPRLNAICDELASRGLLRIERSFMGNTYRAAH